MLKVGAVDSGDYCPVPSTTPRSVAWGHLMPNSLECCGIRVFPSCYQWFAKEETVAMLWMVPGEVLL